MVERKPDFVQYVGKETKPPVEDGPKKIDENAAYRLACENAQLYLLNHIF